MFCGCVIVLLKQQESVKPIIKNPTKAGLFYISLCDNIHYVKRQLSVRGRVNIIAIASDLKAYHFAIF